MNDGSFFSWFYENKITVSSDDGPIEIAYLVVVAVHTIVIAWLSSNQQFGVKLSELAKHFTVVR
jgi:hypothetical protein